jgi:hypothetical protein
VEVVYSILWIRIIGDVCELTKKWEFKGGGCEYKPLVKVEVVYSILWIRSVERGSLEKIWRGYCGNVILEKILSLKNMLSRHVVRLSDSKHKFFWKILMLNLLIQVQAQHLFILLFLQNIKMVNDAVDCLFVFHFCITSIQTRAKHG